MKKLLITLVIVTPLTLSADNPGKYKNVSTTIRDAATHESLSTKLKTSQKSDPIRTIGPPKGKVNEDPAKEMAKRDLIAESTVVCYRGFLTLLPKKSVLHVPEHLEERIGVQPDAKVLTWQNFFKPNRGWIRTIEVTRDQARGYAEIPESIRTAVESSNALVVATYKGGPVSVLPLKEPEDIPSPSETRPITYRN